MAALRGYEVIDFEDGKGPVPVVLPKEFARIMRDVYYIRKGIGTLTELRELPARDGQLIFFILKELDKIEAEKREAEQRKMNSGSKRRS